MALKACTILLILSLIAQLARGNAKLEEEQIDKLDDVVEYFYPEKESEQYEDYEELEEPEEEEIFEAEIFEAEILDEVPPVSEYEPDMGPMWPFLAHDYEKYQSCTDCADERSECETTKPLKCRKSRDLPRQVKTMKCRRSTAKCLCEDERRYTKVTKAPRKTEPAKIKLVNPCGKNLPKKVYVTCPLPEDEIMTEQTKAKAEPETEVPLMVKKVRLVQKSQRKQTSKADHQLSNRTKPTKKQSSV